MRYQEISIDLDSSHSEALFALLWERSLPFQECDQTTLDPPPAGRTRVNLYLDEAEHALVPELLAALKEAVPPAARLDVKLRDRDDAEWRDSWKRYFETRRLGRLAIVPSWEADQHAAQPDEVTLHLDPGRAFGTGGHASTRLCLRLLDELNAAAPVHGALNLALTASPQPEILDVGCGCGVLAIAGLRLWPQARGLAIDIDPEAIEVTVENMERNGVTDRLLADTTPLEDVQQRFVLILANLTGPTLLELAEPLCARLAPGGMMILSGILTSEADAVAHAFTSRGLAAIRHETEEEWSALQLARM